MREREFKRLEKRLEQLEGENPDVQFECESLTSEEKEGLNDLFSGGGGEELDAELRGINEETNGLSPEERIAHWRASQG